MTDNTQYKLLLTAEKSRLEEALSRVGHKNPDIKGDWEPSAPDLNNPFADPNDVADSITAFEDNAAIEVELEGQLAQVDAALARIEESTYGICTVCKTPIEEKRLHANPSATTCIMHREE